MALAVDYINMANANTMYDCDELCNQFEFIKDRYGHENECDLPEGTYLDMGPWTNELKLRNCPTYVLSQSNQDYGVFLSLYNRFEKYGPMNNLGSDFWPTPLIQAFDLIRRTQLVGKNHVQEVDRQRRQAKNR